MSRAHPRIETTDLETRFSCSRLEKGRPVQDYEHVGTHVLTKMDSAIIRYIFLLPKTVGRNSLPHMHQADKEFFAAFKKIREASIKPAKSE